jgi:hypothetical protein
MDMREHASDGGHRRFTTPFQAMEIISDSTLCLTPHGLARRCRACGTVYRSSVVAPVAAPGGLSCPYCRSPGTEPVLSGEGDPRNGWSGRPRPAPAVIH